MHNRLPALIKSSAYLVTLAVTLITVGCSAVNKLNDFPNWKVR